MAPPIRSLRPQVEAKPNGLQVFRRLPSGRTVGSPTNINEMTEEERLDAQALGLPVPQKVINLPDAADAASANRLLAIQRQNEQIIAKLEENYRISYLNALCAQPQPVGSVYASKTGAVMTSAAYVEIFKNTRPRPVALQVFGEWAGGSPQCYLSRSTDLSHEQVVDVIGAPGTGYPANGNTQSRVILIPPQGFVYIAPVDFNNFPPTVNDKFRIKVWSPDEWLDGNNFTNR